MEYGFQETVLSLEPWMSSSQTGRMRERLSLSRPKRTDFISWRAEWLFGCLSPLKCTTKGTTSSASGEVYSEASIRVLLKSRVISGEEFPAFCLNSNFSTANRMQRVLQSAACGLKRFPKIFLGNKPIWKFIVWKGKLCYQGAGPLPPGSIWLTGFRVPPPPPPPIPPLTQPQPLAHYAKLRPNPCPYLAWPRPSSQCRTECGPDSNGKKAEFLWLVFSGCSQVCRWLGTRAEELGVDIFPGFAAAEVLYDRYGGVAGVATGDMGIAKVALPLPKLVNIWLVGKE